AAERAPRSPLMLLRRTPKGPLALILLLTLLLGYSLPVLGASIVLFLLADVLRYAWLRRRQAD
ncbi:PepSY domain-containing protein, partial [Serratia rubidaea]|nr:PepSY domain-containing protein [Serratia rubidaea]